MLVLHSGGKATKALGLAWSYDPTKFVDSVRAATDTTVDTAT